ncbi:hypothetical protein EWM64_g5766 [Hericium alpestre]|uniref:Uncharacterized protein n=1 Tax=Hericium alpestre TaxID=135208 RepID=A0A4Y9ZW07_9AGAM|nr:hypothetical protein EWM64_g5766 [Hericium alpestre]
MAPATRSAPTTPISKKPTSSTTPNSSARKVPHCTKCHRPRAGHPRQGCPYVDSPSPAATQAAEARRIPPAHDISDALGSMQIEEPERSSPTPTARPLPTQQQSLASLSTTSSEVIRKLLEPGIMDGHGDESASQFIEKWRTNMEKVESPTKAAVRRKEGRVMPGTLITPRSSLVPTEPATSHGQINPEHVTKTDVEDESALRRTPQPLARSMSMVEKEAFLNGVAHISKAPPVSIYVVPLVDLYILQTSAAKVSFKTRALEPRKGSGETNGILVIGSDDAAVQKVYDRLALDVKKKGMRAINVAAGGAVVGAVATFTGLAFA